MRSGDTTCTHTHTPSRPPYRGLRGAGGGRRGAQGTPGPQLRVLRGAGGGHAQPANPFLSEHSKNEPGFSEDGWMDGHWPRTPLLPGISLKRNLCGNTKLNSDVALAMVFFVFVFCFFCWVWTCLHLVVPSAFINSVAVVWNRLGIRCDNLGIWRLVVMPR